jgi:hypothetical protein
MTQNPGLPTPDLPLHDIHLPAAVGYWPPAPGWWLLLGLLALLILLTFFGWRFWRARRLRRLALARLVEVARLPETQLATALSRLLRQAAISHFPQDSAGLSGRAWLEFLDRPLADRPFTEGVGRSLLDAPYRADAQIDGAALIALCRRWLKKLPPQSLPHGRGR